MTLIPTGEVSYDVYVMIGDGNFLGSLIDNRTRISKDEAIAWAKKWKKEYGERVVIVKHETFEYESED